MVSGQDDGRVLSQSRLIERIENPAEPVIEMGDLACITRQLFQGDSA